MPLTVERKLIIDRSLGSSSVLTHPYKSFYLFLRLRASSPVVMQQTDKETTSRSDFPCFCRHEAIFVDMRLFLQIRHLCDLSLLLFHVSDSFFFHVFFTTSAF